MQTIEYRFREDKKDWPGGDLCPRHQRWEQEHGFDSRDYDTYKDFAYVTHEVTRLAAQLSKAAQ